MKKYSVKELSDELGVARTTVNDWLSRYDQFIEVKMQGKRKVYTETTLEVLKSVATLKAAGLSSFDIEEQLETLHALHVEVDDGKKAETETDSAKSEVTTETALAAPSVKPEDFALMNQQQTEELGKMLAAHLQNMTTRLETLEANSSKDKKRANLWLSLVAILALVIAVGTVFGYTKINSLNNESKSLLGEKGKLEVDKASLIKDKNQLTEDNSKTKSELTDKNSKLEESKKSLAERDKKIFDLSLKAKDLDKEIVKIEAGMKEHKKDYEISLKDMAKSKEEKEAEIIKMREEFAKKTLEILKQLSQAKADSVEKKKVISGLREVTKEQSKAIKDLAEELTEQKIPEKVDPEELPELKNVPAPEAGTN